MRRRGPGFVGTNPAPLTALRRHLKVIVAAGGACGLAAATVGLLFPPTISGMPALVAFIAFFVNGAVTMGVTIVLAPLLGLKDPVEEADR